MTKFEEIFEKHGFATPDQQGNLVRLLYLAGCFEPDLLVSDLKETGHDFSQVENAVKVAYQVAKKPKDLQQFDADIVLKNLFLDQIEEDKWPKKIHDWLIKTTQRVFFMRSSGQERWEQMPARWIQAYESEVLFISHQLGVEV